MLNRLFRPRIDTNACARVYAAAYASSGIHNGMQACTPPDIARKNAEDAVGHFVNVIEDLRNG